MSTIDIILKLKEEKMVLIMYMQAKLAASDWHAVSDAANDIREIEAQLNVLEKL